jgi:hypothetical protein
MRDHPAVPDAAIAGRNRVCFIVQGLLRSAQQSGWTDETLHAASGVPARTIKSYRVEGKEPCLTNALSIALVLGAPAINSVLALIGYGGATPLDEADELRPAVIVATGLDGFSVIARAAADGRIDHTELPDCRRAADAIIESVLPLSSAGQAQ